MAYVGTGTVNTFLQATTSGPKYSASTFTIGGNLAFSGAFATTITVTNTTSVTLPTSGTLATTAQLPSITATQFDVLVGGAANAIVSVGPGSAGQVLQSGGNASNPVYSTATYPATATGTGTLLRADGTNWVATTSTYPNTNAVSTLLYASSSNVMAALATANNGTLVTSNTGVPSILAGPGTTGNIFQSNAAAAPSFSTATYPSTATGTGTLLRADGTNWVATTSTYPNTNAVSTLLYASSANIMAALPTANSGVLITSSGGVPSISSTLPSAVQGNITSTGNLGNQTNTTRSAFSAYLNTTVNNVTGDLTVYTIIFDTELFDQNNDFNLGTSTFTAPVTGKYYFNLVVSVVGGTVINQGNVRIATTARTYQQGVAAGISVTTTANGTLSVLADMTANDTCTFQVATNDTGGKVDDVQGLVGGILRTFVEGYLVC